MARGLTSAEIALARRAFAGAIDYGRVRLVEGPAASLPARLAFAKGNPAITIGSTVYFAKPFSADFAAPGGNAESFMHEMTHVWQYQRLGFARFLLRYAREFAAVGAKASRMYAYQPGATKFVGAMLEAQAQMVGDYSEALVTGREPKKALLARNLAGSGVYGL